MEHGEDWKPFLVVPGNPDARKVLPGTVAHSVSIVEALKPEAEPVYGLPDKKKYPMPDRDHVLSAIRFFNYVDPTDEERLAKAILKRMRELNVTGIKVGEVNRFKKYYDKSTTLAHHGVKGMKWGVWNEETRARRTGVSSKKNRYLNEDGSLTSSGKNRYLEKDANVVYKDLKKQIQKQRKDVHGGSNRWMINTPIGEHSKKYLEEIHKKEKEYKTSKEYLDWEKEYKTWKAKAEKQLNSSNLEKYTKEEEELLARKPRKNFNSPYDAAVSY